MRVVSGSAKGRRLFALEGMQVRPTTDRVKEAVFSIIQFEIEGRKVLDLFAGSGQMGIEALSRKAEYVVFVDNNKFSYDVINKNLEVTGFKDKASVILSDAISFLKKSNEKFDVAFLDPPYESDVLLEALKKLAEKMSEGAIIICETSEKEDLPFEIGRFQEVKTYRYGKTIITLYRDN